MYSVIPVRYSDITINTAIQIHETYTMKTQNITLLSKNIFLCVIAKRAIQNIKSQPFPSNPSWRQIRTLSPRQSPQPNQKVDIWILTNPISFFFNRRGEDKRVLRVVVVSSGDRDKWPALFVPARSLASEWRPRGVNKRAKAKRDESPAEKVYVGKRVISRIDGVMCTVNGSRSLGPF